MISSILHDKKIPLVFPPNLQVILLDHFLGYDQYFASLRSLFERVFFSKILVCSCKKRRFIFKFKEILKAKI